MLTAQKLFEELHPILLNHKLIQIEHDQRLLFQLNFHLKFNLINRIHTSIFKVKLLSKLQNVFLPLHFIHCTDKRSETNKRQRARRMSQVGRLPESLPRVK